MLRQLHSLAGLVSAVLIVLLGITGALLSLDPALDRLGARPAPGMNVAELADRVLRQYPGAEQIERTPSGTIIVYYATPSGPGADRIDPRSGRAIAPHAPSAFSRWVRKLHRSLLIETPGRAATGLAALAMLVLCISGALLLARRLGGWRQLLHPMFGNRSQRWHAQTGRLAVAGLLVSALSGAYMSAVSFELIPDGMQAEPDFPAVTSGGTPAPPARLAGMKASDLSDLRELVFPVPGDSASVYTLRTMQGDGYVDPSSGALLSYRAHSPMRAAYELVYMLHTGEGLWWLGLVLGLCALGATWLAGTGATLWWQRRRARPRIAGNGKPQSADAVILVGSENNSTWGFAAALHDALRKAGRRVHSAPMNDFSARFDSVRDLFLLTATYGEGQAPASASQFLALLERAPPRPAARFHVLGFGDRQFATFCQFASEVDAAMQAHGWRRGLEPATIDRQSPQQFAQWGERVGALLGVALRLEHTPRHPHTVCLRLQERVDYGLEAQEPTVVLRFDASPPPPKRGLAARLLHRVRLPRFEAGDLLGVIAPGSPLPRFYSLASSVRDGILEICVRRQTGGLCSTYLHGLRPGECITAFIQPNPQFRPASGKAPVILIGAGTGIGPLAGFIRNNSGKHPMYLYWGGRDPASDFLYEPELRLYLADRRLTQLHTAFSRVANGARVHTRLAEDEQRIRQLVAGGGQILLCGSRAMARNVRQALDDILAPLGLDVQAMRIQGRYREDVF